MPPPAQKPNTSKKNTPKTRSASASSTSGMATLDNFFQSNKQPIDVEEFKKLGDSQKLDSIAQVMNNFCSSLNNSFETLKNTVETKLSSLDSLEQKIDSKLDPLWDTVFEEESGLQTKVSNLETTVLKDDEGLKDKVRELEAAAEDSNKQFKDLLEENETIKSELKILKGILHKHDEQISSVADGVVSLNAKTMEKNITINGLQEVKDENVRITVLSMLADHLQMAELGEIDLKAVFRIGTTVNNSKPRPVILKCSPKLRLAILSADKKWKEDHPGQKPPYSISPQLPEKMAETKREIRHLIWEQKSKEEHLTTDQKAKITVQNNIVYVNKEPVKRKLPALKPFHLFPRRETQDRIDAIQMYRSDVRPEKGSTFQAYAAKISSPEEAHLMHIKVRQIHPSATHVAAAYVGTTENSYAFHNDGEHGSGLKLIRTIKEENHSGVTVCLVRRFGGTHLGPLRFQLMAEVAKKALQKIPQE